MGARFGGPKQLVAVGPAGESILYYNARDAVAAGFERVVVVTRPELEDDVRNVTAAAVNADADWSVVLQRVPEHRSKPYGSAEALVVAAAAHRAGALGVANADDLYGPGSFVALHRHLVDEPEVAGIVGFRLIDTVPAVGSVTRGLLEVEGADVRRVHEVQGVARAEGGWTPARVEGVGDLHDEVLVSMNLLALPADAVHATQIAVDRFVAEASSGADHATNNGDLEIFLPEVIDALVAARKLRIRLLRTTERWAGITNPGDVDLVRQAASLRGR